MDPKAEHDKRLADNRAMGNKLIEVGAVMVDPTSATGRMLALVSRWRPAIRIACGEANAAAFQEEVGTVIEAARLEARAELLSEIHGSRGRSTADPASGDPGPSEGSRG